MTSQNIKNKIIKATNIASIHVDEFPIDVIDPIYKHCFLINVGPLPINIDNPTSAFQHCVTIIESILESLVHESTLCSCRIGISLFAMPGGQAFRVLSGSYDIVGQDSPPYRLSGLYSNIKSIHEIIKNDATNGDGENHPV